MKDIVVVDLDDTLACNAHRLHHILNTPKNWDAFFAECPMDPPVEAVIQVVQNMYAARYQIWILSARNASVRKQTEEWLERYEVPYDVLIMREIKDRTSDDVLKIQWARENDILDRILFVMEDRTRVVNAWRSLGVPCFQVRPGDF